MQPPLKNDIPPALDPPAIVEATGRAITPPTPPAMELTESDDLASQLLWSAGIFLAIGLVVFGFVVYVLVQVPKGG